MDLASTRVALFAYRSLALTLAVEFAIFVPWVMEAVPQHAAFASMMGESGSLLSYLESPLARRILEWCAMGLVGLVYVGDCRVRRGDGEPVHIAICAVMLCPLLVQWLLSPVIAPPHRY